MGARRMVSGGQTQLSQLHTATSGKRGGKQAACLLYGDLITDLTAEQLKQVVVHGSQNTPLFFCLLHVIYSNGPPQLSCLLPWSPRMKATAFMTNTRVIQNYYLRCRLWTPNCGKGYQELEKWLGSCPLSQLSHPQTNPPFLPFLPNTSKSLTADLLDEMNSL